MSGWRLLAAGLALWLGMTATAAAHGKKKGSWSIGLHFGTPAYRHCSPWRCCDHYYPRYLYRPVYLAPQPVYVSPPPVVIQQPPAPRQPVQPARPAQPDYDLPPPTPVPSTRPTAPTNQVYHFVSRLADSNEGIRLESVAQLGRSKSEQAIDPLAATLSGDQSPAVRESAARALGIIGSPKCLPALNRAAQLDVSPDVRKMAQFAAEIIQSR